MFNFLLTYFMYFHILEYIIINKNISLGEIHIKKFCNITSIHKYLHLKKSRGKNLPIYSFPGTGQLAGSVNISSSINIFMFYFRKNFRFMIYSAFFPFIQVHWAQKHTKHWVNLSQVYVNLENLTETWGEIQTTRYFYFTVLA